MNEQINNDIIKNLAARTEVSEEEAERKLTETLNDPENLESVQKQIDKMIAKRQAAAKPMNREQRRRLMKKAGKAGRQQMASINETTKKLNYINLIEQLRELNKKKENENYEDAVEDN